MTKIGLDKPIFEQVASGDQGSVRESKSEFKFAQTVASAKQSGKSGSDADSSTHASSASQGSAKSRVPPSYDLTKMASIENVAGLLENAGGADASLLRDTISGFRSDDLPSVAIINSSGSGASPSSSISLIGNTVFIPANVYESWSQGGSTAPDSVRDLVQAVQKALGKNGIESN